MPPLVLIPPYAKKLPLTDGTAISGRTVRLVATGARNTSGGYPTVGVYEFELYDSVNRNLCRTSGYTPTVLSSPNAGVSPSYPEKNAIDGVFSGDWTKTCYIYLKALDGSAYLEFTFAADINPTKWRMTPEGSWLPTTNGMKLLFFKNGSWLDITGTSGATDWTPNVWREFSIPAIP